jgi:hypothetical protein
MVCSMTKAVWVAPTERHHSTGTPVSGKASWASTIGVAFR